jgi:hypothetical protein
MLKKKKQNRTEQKKLSFHLKNNHAENEKRKKKVNK